VNPGKREGRILPNVVFRTRAHHRGVDVKSERVCKGPTVVVSGLPGVFGTATA